MREGEGVREHESERAREREKEREDIRNATMNAERAGHPSLLLYFLPFLSSRQGISVAPQTPIRLLLSCTHHFLVLIHSKVRCAVWTDRQTNAPEMGGKT